MNKDAFVTVPVTQKRTSFGRRFKAAILLITESAAHEAEIRTEIEREIELRIRQELWQYVYGNVKEAAHRLIVELKAVNPPYPVLKMGAAEKEREAIDRFFASFPEFPK